MLRGVFTTMPPADLLEWLGRRRVSGALVVERGELTRTIQVTGGVVVRVASTHPAEHLGRLLVGAGYLSEQRLLAARTGEPLGQALVAAGLVAEGDLRAVLEQKIKEALYELLSWTDGSFTFDPSGPAARREVQVAVPLRDVLGEGERRAALWRAVRERIPDEDCRFRVIHLEGTADELLQDVARGLTVREILLERRSLPFPVYKALAELIERGVIVTVATEADRAARVAAAARALLTRRGVPRLARPREDVLAEDLSAAERALLARIDGRWDLMTLLRTSALGEVEALLTMERLTTRGLVTM